VDTEGAIAHCPIRWQSARVGGILYAVGGVACSRPRSGDGRGYDPATLTHDDKGVDGHARLFPAAGSVNGTLYAVGGVNTKGYLRPVEAYDPVYRHLDDQASMPTARYGLAADVVNGIPQPVGGDPSPRVVEAYDQPVDAWNDQHTDATARTQLGVALWTASLRCRRFNPAATKCRPSRRATHPLPPARQGVDAHRARRTGRSESLNGILYCRRRLTSLG